MDTLNQGFILRGYEEDDDIVVMIVHELAKSLSLSSIKAHPDTMSIIAI